METACPNRAAKYFAFPFINQFPPFLSSLYVSPLSFLTLICVTLKCEYFHSSPTNCAVLNTAATGFQGNSFRRRLLITQLFVCLSVYELKTWIETTF